MKRKMSFVLLTFAFALLSLCVSVKVNAANLWELFGGYRIDEADVDSKYQFYSDYNNGDKDDDTKTSNFNFAYEYVIKANIPITNNDSDIYYFYGAHESLTVDYVDLTDITRIDDEFKVYRYNFVSQEFDTIHAPGSNKSGSYTLEKGNSANLYKLEATGLNGVKETNTVYVIIDDKITSGSYDGTVVDQEAAQIKINVKFTMPFSFEKLIQDVKVYCGDTDISGKILKANQVAVEGSNEYGLEIIVDVINLTAIDEPLTVVIYGYEFDCNNISFDFVSPVVHNGNFYHPDLVIPGFEAKSPLVPNKWVYKFEYSDAGTIASITSNFDNVECVFGEGVATCNGDSSIANEDGETILKFFVEDELGNSSELGEEVIFSQESLSIEELSELTTIENDTILLSDVTKISKLCVFYGETLDDIYECSSSGNLTASEYYKGPVIMVVIDKGENVVFLEKEVIFTKGYDIDNEHIVTNIENAQIEEAYNTLIAAMGFTDLDEFKKYVDYGNFVEEYNSENEISLDLLKLLNEYRQDKICAFESCDHLVVAYLEFEVAGVKQTIPFNFLFKDNLPNIITSTVTDDINLGYKKFDITNVKLQGSLFAHGYDINLLDEDDNSYKGEITTSFVKFIDKDGNVELLNNKPYDYIASVNKVGTYVLEGRVRILKNLTTNEEYTDRYGKSFFINVNLNDVTKPTVTLLGESEITIKQHDVYKDSGAKCEDDIACEITVAYYLDGKQVESIDTSVEGEYIIEYTATDVGGNVAKTTRTVIVKNINSLDITSIIIIVSVVVLFIIFITAGIIIERKKARRGFSSRED